MADRTPAVDTTFAQPGLSLLPAVRDLARQATADVDDGGHRDAVTLVVSELVANAVLHGRLPVRLAIDREPHGTTVDVYDAAPDRLLLAGTPRRLGHFGLDIVELLTGGVHVHVEGRTKRVSAFVPLWPWPGSLPRP